MHIPLSNVFQQSSQNLIIRQGNEDEDYPLLPFNLADIIMRYINWNCDPIIIIIICSVYIVEGT